MSISYDVAIRVPHLVEALDRDISQGVCELMNRFVAVMFLIVMCSLHGAMRTGENMVNLINAPFRVAYKDGHDGARTKIEGSYNVGMKSIPHPGGGCSGVRTKIYLSQVCNMLSIQHMALLLTLAPPSLETLGRILLTAQRLNSTGKRCACSQQTVLRCLVERPSSRPLHLAISKVVDSFKRSTTPRRHLAKLLTPWNR